MTIFKPYQLVSREVQPQDTLISIQNTVIGRDFVMIAGMCSVETEETTLYLAKLLHSYGIKFFRAGAFKPRTSPYSFQGLGIKGLEILAQVKQQTGMAIVTEVMDTETLQDVAAVADIVQIGARNMSNTSLLKAVGKINNPILLKRGAAATIDEWLMAAEYIVLSGNPNVILCERGIRTFNEHCRNTLDIAAIPYVKEKSHLPIIIDPSHAAGQSNLVTPLARAAVAAGAQGLMIEVHHCPEQAYSDGQQALLPAQLFELQKQISCFMPASCESLASEALPG